MAKSNNNEVAGNAQKMNLKECLVINAYVLVAAVVLTSGCSKTVSSEGIETESMHLFATVIDDGGNNVDVTASVDDGEIFGASYRLTPSEYFRACVNSDCERLEFDLSYLLLPGAGTPYDGSLPSQAGEDYVVSLHRPEYTEATNSNVSLPDYFELLSPIENVTYTDGDSILIRWLPEGIGENVSAKTSANCTHEDGSTSVSAAGTSDSGEDGEEEISIEDTLAATDLFSESPIQNCSIEVVVTHERRGTIDSVYEGGSIIAQVVRRVFVNYIPLQ